MDIIATVGVLLVAPIAAAATIGNKEAAPLTVAALCKWWRIQGPDSPKEKGPAHAPIEGGHTRRRK